MKAIAVFCLKFLFIVPVCLVAWWLVLPWYAWCLGHVAKALLSALSSIPVQNVTVVPGGILNTGTSLTFVLDHARPSIQVAGVVSNLAPYVALVLATRSLPLRRRLAALAIGAGILWLGHQAYVTLALVFSSQIQAHPAVPRALGELFITLPFPLWIVLASWHHHLGDVAHHVESGGSAPE